MNTWVKSLLIGFVLAGFYFLYATKWSKKANQKSYTASFTIVADPDTAQQSRKNIYTLINYFEKKIQKLGYPYSIKELADENISVQVQNIKDTAAIYTSLSSPSVLQFWETYNITELEKMMQALLDTLPKLLSKKKKATPKINNDTLSPSIRALLDSLENPSTGTEWLDFMDINQSYMHERLNVIVHPGAIAQVRPRDSVLINRLVDVFREKNLLPADAVLCWGMIDAVKAKRSPDQKILPFYFLKTRMRTKAFLENEDILEASTSFDPQGRVEIFMNFKKTSVHKWSNLTELNIGRSIAIVLDGKVMTSPTVESRIEEGSSTISGTFTYDEAERLSEQLTSEKIPLRYKITRSSFALQKPAIKETRIALICLAFFAGFTILAFNIFRILANT